jgi:hypothetical protein
VRSGSAPMAASDTNGPKRVCRRWHCLALFAILFLLAGLCHAERVVIVRPTSTEFVLTEVFHRLQGELRMHGFETILASAGTIPSPNEMQRVAELAEAAATIAFDRVDGEPIAHVWFVDRETQQSRVLSIAVPETEETPTLLALKTVELLRGSLREHMPAAVSAPEVVTKPASSAKRGTDVGKPPSGARSVVAFGPRFTARLDAALLWTNPQQSAVMAPALSIGYDVMPRWQLAARLVVPLRSQQFDATRASADLRVNLGLVELRWSVGPGSRAVALEPLIAVGAARCSAVGHATYPVEGRNVTAWLVTAALGLGGWVALSPRWSLGRTTRIGAFAPKPLLRVDRRDETFGRPWLEVGVSVTYRL